MTDTDNTQLAMTDQDNIAPREVGDPVPDLNTLDTNSTYSFDDLPAAVEFAKIMAQAGPMIPKHCQRNAGVCLAILYRAKHWGLDPFALAQESYQVREGAPVAYMSSVFSALLIKNGISLNYEYTGETHFTAAAAQSAKGNKVADQTAAGTRQCTVTGQVNGEDRSYTTPMLKDIKVKNSPLWHNDPDQQLGYYSARSWARRYRPDLMMGVLTVEDVQENPQMRNVTPRDEARGGFSKMIAKARSERSAPDQSETLSNDDEPETGADDEPEIDPDHPAFKMGFDAAAADLGAGECPFREDPDSARHWLAGWESHPVPDEEGEGE
jgi:ribosome modulation factor